MQRPTHAISIRQPYVELILRDEKKAEYHSRSTNIRGRVYLYASPKPVDWPAGWRKVGAEPGTLPIGAIVGTVEIVGCRWDKRRGCYAYILRDSKRFRQKLCPKSRPNPCFWRPKF